MPVQDVQYENIKRTDDASKMQEKLSDGDKRLVDEKFENIQRKAEASWMLDLLKGDYNTMVDEHVDKKLLDDYNDKKLVEERNKKKLVDVDNDNEMVSEHDDRKLVHERNETKLIDKDKDTVGKYTERKLADEHVDKKLVDEHDDKKLFDENNDKNVVDKYVDNKLADEHVDKKLIDEHDDFHPTIDPDTHDEERSQSPTPRSAAGDAMALHELLSDPIDVEASAEATGVVPATITVIEPPNSVSQGRRSAIGRRATGGDKRRRNSVEPATENTVKVAISSSQGRRSSIGRHLIANKAEKARRASVDQETRTRDEQIAAILCPRTNAERLEILCAYSSLFNEELIPALKQKLTGDFAHLILAIMETPARFDAIQLHQAIHTLSKFTGLSTKNHALIEILCTRSAAEISAIKNEYRYMFDSYLENDISKVTWHHLMHLFMWLCSAVRDESEPIDRQRAHQDATALYAAEAAHFSRDSTFFAFILSTQSISQLKVILNEYRHIAGVDFEKVVDRDFSGDFREALTAIIMTVNDELPIYFAHRLHKALHGIGSHDTSLIRLIVARSDIDMLAICEEYEQLYNSTVEHDIKAYCSGCYREGLLHLIHRS
uniref:Annexin n=1 Tax=Plectus sambesii TaxID=2011161 RepID=A0A914XCD4_9BILA